VKVLAVTNMYPTTGAPRNGTFVEQQVQGLRTIGLDVEVLHVARVRDGVICYTATGRLVRERLAASRPDVVHAMYGGLFGELVIRAAGGHASVLSVCGTDLIGLRSGPWLMKVRTRFSVLCTRRAACRADHIIAKSRELEQLLPAEVNRAYVSVIPNGIDLSRFRPLDRDVCRAKLGWSPEKFHVLICTTALDDPGKRVGLAIDAVARLIAGGVNAKLHVMMNTPHHEVPVWLNAADVLLMTSTHEGSPNIIKEALACNRPVVSTDVGDVAERIGGIDGCHVTVDDADIIADALRQVHLGLRVVDARSIIGELSIENIAQRLREAYGHAIARASGRAS